MRLERDYMLLSVRQQAPLFIQPIKVKEAFEDRELSTEDEHWRDLNYATRVLAGRGTLSDNSDIARGMLHTLARSGATPAIKMIALTALTNKLTDE